MTYVNQAVTTRERLDSQTSKRETDKLRSLAMTNFVEPTLVRAYKVKSPLKSVSSVLFLPSPTSVNPQWPEGLLVADPVAGKIVIFNSTDGRYQSQLTSSVEARDLCMCGDDCLAMVDSNEWGSCVKIVSLDGGHVLTTWGRQLDTWTPGAVTTTVDGDLVVGNTHPEASSRLTLFTPDGKQISQFGRAVGPGDLFFRSPVSLATDSTSGRIFAADADSGCVKIFDTRCSPGFVAEFGSKSTSGSTSPSTGSGNECGTLERPVGVCCDGLGNAVVCDSDGRRVVLFSREGRYICNLVDFRSTTGSQGRWRPKRNGRGDLVPVCVGLSSPGSRIAVGLEDNGVKSHRFRKIISFSVSPEL